MTGRFWIKPSDVAGSALLSEVKTHRFSNDSPSVGCVSVVTASDAVWRSTRMPSADRHSFSLYLCNTPSKRRYGTNCSERSTHDVHRDYVHLYHIAHSHYTFPSPSSASISSRVQLMLVPKDLLLIQQSDKRGVETRGSPFPHQSNPQSPHLSNPPNPHHTSTRPRNHESPYPGRPVSSSSSPQRLSSLSKTSKKQAYPLA